MQKAWAMGILASFCTSTYGGTFDNISLLAILRPVKSNEYGY